jgi:hypothetical protein
MKSRKPRGKQAANERRKKEKRRLQRQQARGAKERHGAKNGTGRRRNCQTQVSANFQVLTVHASPPFYIWSLQIQRRSHPIQALRMRWPSTRTRWRRLSLSGLNRVLLNLTLVALVVTLIVAPAPLPSADDAIRRIGPQAKRQTCERVPKSEFSRRCMSVGSVLYESPQTAWSSGRFRGDFRPLHPLKTAAKRSVSWVGGWGGSGLGMPYAGSGG